MIRRAAIAAHLAPLAGYLLLTLLVFAPALPSFAHALPGGPVAESDAWQNVWNLWWVQRALAAGESPFYTTLLYHPHGTGLYLQTLNVTNGLLALPVTAALGPVAGYNLALLVAFTLSGYAAYLLALRASGHRAAAFVGGAIFAFSPFHMTKAWDGQLEQIALQWTAFYALFLLRAAEDARRRDALLAGGFLALVGYTSWYYFLFFAVYSALFALVWLAAAPSWASRRRMLVQLVITGAAGVALVLPILIPALRRVGGDAGPPEPPFNPDNPLDLILIHSANLYDLLLPSGLHPLWGGAVERLVKQWHPYIAAWNVALGYTALLLAAAALWGRDGRRRTKDEGAGVVRAGPPASTAAPSSLDLPPPSHPWRFAVIALTAAVLALGPVLHVGTWRSEVLLPYAALLSIPGADIARRPSHFIVITVLMLAPLAAIGLRALLERLPPARRPLLLGAAALALAVELAPPAWPLIRSEPHPYYARVAAQPGALIDLPPRLESPRPLEAQIVHGQPILGGYVSRLPPYPFAEQAPGVRELWGMAPTDEALLAGGPEARLDALRAYGVRHVVVHWDAVPPDRRPGLEAALAQALPGVPHAYADGALSAYLVPEGPPRPVAFFGAGWYGEERDGDRRWRWMSGSGEVILVNPTDAPAAVTLDLAAYGLGGERDVTLALGEAPLGIWRTGAPRALRLLLPPGEHRLTLRAPASREDGGTRALSIALTEARLR